MSKKGSLLGQGYTAEIFEWGPEAVLKLYREGLPESLCEEEFKNTQIVYSILNNVPKPVEMVTVQGRAGGIYRRIMGSSMLKMMLIKPWRFKSYAEQMAVHHLAIQKSTGELITVKEKLKRDIACVATLEETEKQQVLRYLEPLPGGDIICHFDYHPGNIILEKGLPVILDWMTACRGDGLADVARTGIILNFA